ncbi:CPBP family glutamic-type intramembrane protease [Psychroserpens sp. XS_ASV72]|uniref:CPBP family glutamic-type intramembrane protease n=1 Tax=Psychroserpens sp. XS_ASV72 TaxID=3241293 RepID=UPI0035121DDB
MKSIGYRLTELFFIFVLIPIGFAMEIPFWIKGAIGVLGFLYILFIMLRVERIKVALAPNLNWNTFYKRILFQFLGIMVVTTLYVWIVDRSNLFVVVWNKPLLWLVILFVYAFFSVYPQELIYRTFFFKRYQELFKNQNLFILINATLFSLGHIFFKNSLVMVLTFVGGLLFAYTFKKTQSTILVSIEHAVYGCWLFTVGMGTMLGFPS